MCVWRRIVKSLFDARGGGPLGVSARSGAWFGAVAWRVTRKKKAERRGAIRHDVLTTVDARTAGSGARTMNNKKAEAPEAAPSAPPFIDDVQGPEVYADKAHFFSQKGGNICITFSSARYDNSDGGVLKYVAVERLVLPLEGARGLAIGLYDFLAQRGLAPPQPDPKTAN